MTSSTTTIAPGSRVRLHLAMYLEDGTEALSTFGEEPMELTLGDGTLTSGTEALLLGLGVGATQQITASGDALFGEWTETNLHWLPRADFPHEQVPQPGSLVSFEMPDGTETTGFIKEIAGARVRVDFNHPLSGRALRIQVQVLDVGAPRPDPNTH